VPAPIYREASSVSSGFHPSASNASAAALRTILALSSNATPRGSTARASPILSRCVGASSARAAKNPAAPPASRATNGLNAQQTTAPNALASRPATPANSPDLTFGVVTRLL
jgi:hypothetical protein